MPVRLSLQVLSAPSIPFDQATSLDRKAASNELTSRALDLFHLDLSRPGRRLRRLGEDLLQFLRAGIALQRAGAAARAGDRVRLGTEAMLLDDLLAANEAGTRELIDTWMGPPRRREAGGELCIEVRSAGPAAVGLRESFARLDRDHAVRLILPESHRALEAARILAAEGLEVVIEPEAEVLAPRTLTAAAAAGVADVRLPRDASLELRSLHLACGFPST